MRPRRRELLLPLSAASDYNRTGKAGAAGGALARSRRGPRQAEGRVRRWRAALPWVVPAIGLAALPVALVAAFAPAAGAAASRGAASTAGAAAVTRVVLPRIVVPPLGQTRPLLGQPGSLLGSRTETNNWSGYDVVTGGPFTSVTATWKQPRVRPSSADFTDAVFWVGLDGDTSDPDNDPAQTVEQIGTEGFSLMGHVYYDAWYEMYPDAPHFLNTPSDKQNYLPIHAGDWVTATVTWVPATDATDTSPATLEGFTLTLVDHTTSKSVTKTIDTPKTGVPPARSSVEVVAEAPSLADGSILPIADFGLLSFRDCAFDGQPIGRLRLVADQHGLSGHPRHRGRHLGAEPRGHRLQREHRRQAAGDDGLGRRRGLARQAGDTALHGTRQQRRHRRGLHAVLTRRRLDLDERQVGHAAGPGATMPPTA